jgi:uncharacterized membrane protein YdcZ (DUF606 family)
MVKSRKVQGGKAMKMALCIFLIVVGSLLVGLTVDQLGTVGNYLLKLTGFIFLLAAIRLAMKPKRPSS